MVKWKQIAEERATKLRVNLTHEGISELAFSYARAEDISRTVGGNVREIFLQKLNERKSYDLTHVPSKYQTYFSAKTAYEMTELGKYPSPLSTDSQDLDTAEQSLEHQVDAEQQRILDAQEEFPLTREHARSW